jgi:integrase
MSVYPQKRNGKFTGKWFAEIEREGVRTRRLRSTKELADKVETLLLAGQEVPVSGEAVQAEPVATLGWLKDQAALIWAECKDKQSAARLSVCVDLLGPELDICAVRTLQLDELKAKLKARKPTDKRFRAIKSSKTVHRYLAALSGALKWAFQREIIANKPHIPWPKVTQSPKQFFRPKEEAAIVAYFLDRGNIMMAVVVRVLATTGIRVGELLRLQPENVVDGFVLVGDWEGGTKTGDSRYVPIDESLEQPFRQVLEAGLPSYIGIKKYLRRATEACGIDQRKTPHKLRHTAATRLTQAGVQTFVIQEFMGHKSLTTTRGYVSIEPETLKVAAKMRGAGGGLEGDQGVSERILAHLAPKKDAA